MRMKWDPQVGRTRTDPNEPLNPEFPTFFFGVLAFGGSLEIRSILFNFLHRRAVCMLVCVRTDNLAKHVGIPFGSQLI